jgi:hypothetical protein
MRDETSTTGEHGGMHSKHLKQGGGGRGCTNRLTGYSRTEEGEDQSRATQNRKRQVSIARDRHLE